MRCPLSEPRLPLDLFRHPADAALRRKPEALARKLLWGTVLGVGVLLAWAAVAAIDEVSRGTGQVVPSLRVQMVQNLEGGILREVLVREGDLVEQGALLARIDNETAGSQYRDAVQRNLENLAAAARLEARACGSDPGCPAPEYPAEVRAEPGLTARHDALLKAERAQDAAELDVLEAQVALREHEIAEQRERERQLGRSLELARKQLDMARPLMQARAYSPLDFNSLEQRVQSLAGDLATLALTLPRLEAARAEAAKRLAMRRAELGTVWRNEIHRLEAERASLRELLVAGSDRVTRTEVRSPVRGIVKSVHITTTGGVIRPGESILEVVPLDDTLLVEARMSPSDIAFIHPGQKAVIRLSAYDFAIYGALQGVVDTVSADTLEDRQGAVYYAVKVRTEGRLNGRDGQPLPILPGMLAQVDILTGKKTVLDYLLKPLLKARANALRER